MKFTKCTLGSIINPGHYWVLSADAEHQSEVRLLEDRMTKDMIKKYPSSSPFLSCQMCVAVKDSMSDNLKRGVIKGKLMDNLYEVMLIDYGYCVSLEKEDISIITNKEFMNVEPLAFTVKLYGILPFSWCHARGSKIIKNNMKWPSEVRHFVKDLFKDAPKIAIKITFLKERTAYGDLHIKPKGEINYVSLRKLLLDHDMCAYSEAYFLRNEGLDVPIESLTLEEKMEMVEDWRQKNLRVEKSTHDEAAVDSRANSEDSDGPMYFMYDALSKKNTAKDEVKKTAGGSSGNSPVCGKGRGNLMKLICERKLKETASVDTEKTSPAETVEPPSNLGLRRVGFGRGVLKWKFLEMSEKPPPKTETPVDVWSDAGINSSKHIFSDADSIPEAMNVKESEEESTKRDVEDVPETEYATATTDAPPFVQPDSKDSGAENPSFPDLTWEVKQQDDKNFQPGMVVTSDCWIPFVIFNDSVVEPVNTFRELPIQPTIIWNLETGGSFNQLSQVQRWAIPAIRKQHNTIVIGSSKTGKTLSYVIPLMDYIQDEAFFDELPEGNGPSVVIVAPTSQVCESVYYLCEKLLGRFNKRKNLKTKVKIILALGCQKDVWVHLTNGCDVLITTPHCLVRLLEMPILTNLERLTCLVLDDIDVMSQKPFLCNVRIILERAQFSTKGRHYQKIFCGEKWTPGVENLVRKYVSSHALIIGSYLEAIVYDRLKPSIFLVDREHKAKLFLDKVREKIGKEKILVISENPSEAVFLNNLITEAGITSVVAHENLMADELKRIGTMWKNSSTQWVLVLTDEVLSELKIIEAQALIHYCLPLKSKTNFYLRYSAFQNYLRKSCEVRGGEGKKGKIAISDTILVDNENHYQLPHIVDFVTRLGGKLSPKIIKKCEEIRRVREMEKYHTTICRRLLAFGRCRNQKDCPRRHALVKALDASVDLPVKGWVNFKVIKVHDPSWFSAKLTGHVNIDGTVTGICDDRSEILSKLTEFFKSEANRRPHCNPKTGDVCAVKVEQDQEVFLRAQVAEYLKLDELEQPIEVTVRLMDEGGFRKRKCTELYELPEELARYPPTIVDIRLPGIQPLDFDITWNQVANSFAEKLMTQKLEENQYWSGKIVLTLKDALFLDPVKRKEFLPVVNTHVFDLVLQDELVNAQVAVKNKEYLPSLLKLCAEAGMETPTKEEIKKTDLAKVHPQWAFFDKDFVRVRFLAAEHTTRVFLQQKKFERLLRDLETECQKEGEKKAQEITSRKGKTSPRLDLSVGMFCLARFEDRRWNRGRIEAVNKNRCYVFFVDHGDFLNIPAADVVPISPSLLLRLPFQAIECRLAGIKEEEECPLEVLREIYWFSDDGKDTLYAYIIGKDLESEITKGRKYIINLLNASGTSLNKWLVEEKLVAAEESERNFLEDIEIVGSSEEDEGKNDNEDEDEDENEGKVKNLDLKEKEEEEEEETEVKEKKESNCNRKPSYKGESEESPNPEFWQNYFNNLPEDVFNDEDGLEFLNEKERGSSAAGETKNRLPDKDKGRNWDDQVKVTETMRKVMNLHKKRVKGGERKAQLKSREGVLTPRVSWSQNQVEIQLKILLGNVKDYSIECTVRNISFRCFVEEKFYAVDLKLYGAINPHMTTLVLKAFHVVVTLTKLVPPLWPRLHIDKGKFWWVSLDAESLVDKDGIFEDKIKSVKEAMSAGKLKKGVRGDVITNYCSDSEDDGVPVDSDSECSEIE